VSFDRRCNIKKAESQRALPCVVCHLIYAFRLCRFLPRYIYSEVASQMGIFVFTLMILTPGVDVALFSFFVGFYVALHFISHLVLHLLSVDLRLKNNG
jgi:hypothetical protein